MAEVEAEESDAVAPAATVVVLRNTRQGFELLLVQRARELAFHGGAWVFPGGRVDAADRRGAANEIELARHAAVREAREEAGLLLLPQSLLPIAHWTTPRGRVRRFATWFFLAESTQGAVEVDGREIERHRWISPAAALSLQAAGELVLPVPTFVTVAGLSGYQDAASALEAAALREPEVFVPHARNVPGGTCSLYAGDAAYSGGDLDLPGPRHRLWLIEQGWRYERTGV